MPSYGTIDEEYRSRLTTVPRDDDGPLLMVNFMKYRERADYGGGDDRGLTGREADDAYSPVEILADLGATIVFFGEVEPGGEWDRVAIVRYPTRRSFIEMQDREDFQDKHVHKEAGMERTIICGTLPEKAPPGDGAPVPGGRVVFELVGPGAELSLEGAGRLRVEGTIVGDGRRFTRLGVSWTAVGEKPPAASRERVVAVVKPLLDVLRREFAAASAG